MTYSHLRMEVIMPATSLTQPSNRRERRSLELRERIFRAALALFAKQGFAETTVEEARRTTMPMPEFMRSLAALMTQEPVRNPDIIRVLLLAFLSNSQVREAMLDLQARVLAFHSEMIQIGQKRGEIRNDLPASDIALVFRQTIFGTLLIWSLYGDSSLQSRMDSAFEIIWSGLLPRAPGNLASSDAVASV